MNRLRCVLGQLLWLLVMALTVFFLAEIPA